MSEPFQGFTGPSYNLTNQYASIERTVNWLYQPNESAEDKKSPGQLAPCPGNGQFATLPVPAQFAKPCRGLISVPGFSTNYVFGVNGDTLYSISPTGQYQFLGAVQNDTAPASLTANGNGQLFIASGQQGYVLRMQDGTFTAIPNGQFLGASACTFQDGYILVISPNSRQLQISGTDAAPVGDATAWSAANIAVLAGQSDLILNIISSREYVWMFGQRRSEVWYNVGNSGIGGFPFAIYNDTFLEMGMAAPFALTEFPDSLMWITEDVRGQRMAVRSKGFQPARVSNFAVEEAWSNYSTVVDAIAFSMTFQGHTLYQVTFPTANKTWIYDLTASELIGRPVWTERNFTDARGQQHARPEQFHCYAYGRHLVGSSGLDGNPGAVYQYQLNPWTDCTVDTAGEQTTVPMIADRICPHLWSGNKRVVYNRIEFELRRGIATQLPPGDDPHLQLRWSNDGGNQYGPEHFLPLGKIGAYGFRCYFNRAGYGRDRVFWVRVAGPNPWGLVAAELDTIVTK